MLCYAIVSYSIRAARQDAPGGQLQRPREEALPDAQTAAEHRILSA